MQTMHTANVVHFDLKCDNVLLEPLGAGGEVWEPQTGTSQAPFRVCFAVWSVWLPEQQCQQKLSFGRFQLLQLQSVADDVTSSKGSHPSALLRWCWQTLESLAPLAT
jgi:hypothetical protein